LTLYWQILIGCKSCRHRLRWSTI